MMSESRQPPSPDLVLRALAVGYGPGTVLERHSHRWAQLVYASEGVMRVETEDGVWVVPSHRAVWIPAGIGHAIAMSGQVSMRGRPQTAAADSWAKTHDMSGSHTSAVACARAACCCSGVRPDHARDSTQTPRRTLVHDPSRCGSTPCWRSAEYSRRTRGSNGVGAGGPSIDPRWQGLPRWPRSSPQAEAQLEWLA